MDIAERLRDSGLCCLWKKSKVTSLGFGNLLAERKVLRSKIEMPACNRAKQPVKPLKDGFVL